PAKLEAIGDRLVIQDVGKNRISSRAQTGKGRHIVAVSTVVGDDVVDAEERGQLVLQADVQLGRSVEQPTASRAVPEPLERLGRGMNYPRVAVQTAVVGGPKVDHSRSGPRR